MGQNFKFLNFWGLRADSSDIHLCFMTCKSGVRHRHTNTIKHTAGCVSPVFLPLKAFVAGTSVSCILLLHRALPAAADGCQTTNVNRSGLPPLGGGRVPGRKERHLPDSLTSFFINSSCAGTRGCSPADCERGTC